MARAALILSGRRRQPLKADRISIWLEGRIEVDVVELRGRIEAALALRRGDARDAALEAALADGRPLLPDEPYADWSLGARTRWNVSGRRLGWRWRVIGLQGSAGATPPRLLAAWSAAAAVEPTSEEAAMGLMAVYHETGQRDRAVRAYLRCRAGAAEQLAVEPGKALEEAFRTLAPGRGHTARRPGRRGCRVDGGRRLVGRAELMRALRRRLARAHRGDGPALLLTGPAGIGKSLLLRSVANDAESAGWRVLFGTATSDDGQAPYASLGVALGALGPDEAAPEAGDLLALLGGGAARDDGGGELQRAPSWLVACCSQPPSPSPRLRRRAPRRPGMADRDARDPRRGRGYLHRVRLCRPPSDLPLRRHDDDRVSRGAPVAADVREPSVFVRFDETLSHDGGELSYSATRCSTRVAGIRPSGRSALRAGRSAAFTARGRSRLSQPTARSRTRSTTD